MKAIFKGAMMASVLAMGLGLSACDSAKENAAEDQADAVRQSSEAAADSMENKADAMGGASEDALENKADAVRETGEKKADAMEDQADKMDKTPG
jgi:hypothetical protein